MAKFVSSDTFDFDGSVNKNEASYLLSYTPLPFQADTEQGLAEPSGKKLPFMVTLIGTSVICSTVWIGIAFIVIKLLHR